MLDGPMPTGNRTATALRDLPPGYFALVMATGIVSIAARQLHYRILPDLLFAVAAAAYGLLWALNIARLLAWPSRLAEDLKDPRAGPAFFTTVAATGILGSGSVFLYGAGTAGIAFWIFGFVLWLVLIYFFFSAAFIQKTKGTPAETINGGWLVPVVATQSLAVLGVLVAPQFQGRGEILFVSLCLCLLGAMLYLITISLIVYRCLFFVLPPQAFTPDYWICMGAAAITTLSGSTLTASGVSAGDVLPFLRGLTIFFWAFGTWWIPLLVILEIWKHGPGRVAVHYHAGCWDMVFPLGMYTVCTYDLSEALAVRSLHWIPGGFIFIALTAWGLVFIGLIRNLMGRSGPVPGRNVF